jgi:hypothetical protein
MFGFTLVKKTLGVTAQNASLVEIIRDAAPYKPLLAQHNLWLIFPNQHGMIMWDEFSRLGKEVDIE